MLVALIAGGAFVARSRAAMPQPSDPPRSSGSAEAEEDPSGEAVVATYDGGKVTAKDVLHHYYEMPKWMRGSDSESNRKSRLMSLIDRRLLALEAKDKPLSSDEASLPQVLLERLQIAQLVNEAVEAKAPELSGDARIEARYKTANELARTARATYHVSIDLETLKALDYTQQPASLSRGVEDILKLPAADRRPVAGPFRFASDEFTRCEGEIKPDSATISGRCGCESLTEKFLWEYPLYFELYLSGRGLNVLHAYNVETPPCVTQHLTRSTEYTVDETEAKLQVIQRGFTQVKVSGGTRELDQQVFKRMLEGAGERIAQCVSHRPGKPISSDFTAQWTQLPDGRTLGMTVASDASAKTCVRSVLEEWRFPELVAENTELAASFHLSVQFAEEQDEDN